MDVRNCYGLHQGSYQLLNDASVPLKHRLKLCRMLWVSSSYNPPQKFQKLLNWLCSHLLTSKTSSLESVSLLRSLIEFLNSRQLLESLMMDHNFAIKPSLYQSLTSYLNCSMDTGVLDCIVQISEALVSRKAFSKLSSQFAVYSAFLLSWIEFLIRLLAAVKAEISVKSVVDHVSFLIIECKCLFKTHSCRKQALGSFCESILPVLLKLHYECNERKAGQPFLEPLMNAIDQTVIFILFQRGNMQFREEFSNNSDKEINRRSKKMERIKSSNRAMAAVQALASVDSDTNRTSRLPTYCVSLFFRLCLENSSMEFPFKIKLFQSLSKLCCNCRKKCEEITKCLELNMNMLNSLLQVIVSHRLYQPILDRDLDNPLLVFLNNMLVSLLSHHGVSGEWIRCIVTLANINKSIIEPSLKPILLKSMNTIGEEGVDQQTVFELVHCLVNVYVNDRQSTRLIDIIVDIADNLVKDDVKSDQLLGVIREFGKAFGTKISFDLSASVISKIWLAVANGIHNKLGQDSDDCGSVHLLLSFLAEIANYTPLLMLWDHFTVRLEVIECLRLLDSSLSMMGNLRSENQLFKMHHLKLCVLMATLENKLVRYAIPGTEDVKSCFKNISTKNLNYLIENNNDWTVSDEMKILYLHFLLIKLSDTEESFSLEMHMNNSGETIIRPGTLEYLKEQVESLLLTVPPPITNNVCMSVKVTGEELYFRMMQLLVKFLPSIFCQYSNKLGSWISDVVVFMMFSQDPVEPIVKSELHKFFNTLSEIRNSFFSAVFIEKARNALSACTCRIDGRPVINFDKNTSKLGRIPFSNLENHTEDIMLILNKYIHCIELLEMHTLSQNDISLSFQFLVDLLLLICHIMSNKASDSADKTFVRYVTEITLIADGRHGSLISEHLNVKLILDIARIKSHIQSNLHEPLSYIIQELIIACYAAAPDDAFGTLKKACFSNNVQGFRAIQADLVSQLMQALLYMVMNVDSKDRIVQFDAVSGSRKRKMRTNKQTCKLLKLETGVKCHHSSMQELILENLKVLAVDSRQLLEIERENHCRSNFDLLRSCIECSQALCSNDVDPTGVIQKSFTAAVDDIMTGKPTELQAKLTFVKTCLQCKHITYNHDYQHLQSLMTINVEENVHTELNGCALSLISRMPADYFRGELLKHIGRGASQQLSSEDMKGAISFINILLKPAIMDALFKQDMTKESKKMGHIFTKNLLQMLQICIRNCSTDVGNADATCIIHANTAICSLLKLKWVKFHTSEVSNILALLHLVPMEHFYEKEDSEVFVRLFQSFCNVVHNIILSQENVGYISSVFLSSFRRLLKACLYAAEQRATSPTAVTGAKTSIQCASFMEKLFQLVADGYKTQFSKCMSYVVADYVCLVSSVTLVPSTRKSFTAAAYQLLSMMDEYDVAMIRKALPSTIRDVFQSLQNDFKRNFKYKGFV